MARKLWHPRQSVKKQRHHFANKGPYSQVCSLSISQVWMWELDHKEGGELKNWCFLAVRLRKTFESPMDSKEMKPINLKEINSEFLLEGLMLKPKFQYFGHLIQTINSFEKPWCWERQKTKGEESEDEMTGWHYWCNGHELGRTLGDGEGQGGLVCCSPWSGIESVGTGRMNNKTTRRKAVKWHKSSFCGQNWWGWIDSFNDHKIFCAKLVHPKIKW